MSQCEIAGSYSNFFSIRPKKSAPSGQKNICGVPRADVWRRQAASPGNERAVDAHKKGLEDLIFEPFFISSQRLKRPRQV